MSLRPQPIECLVRRAIHELRERSSAFDLPASRFYGGPRGLDFSAAVHGAPAGTPLGPAAGPHTQLAPNIALAWLAGCRVFELKTVQVNDRLEIPRPCIDMATVGYNVEWSQELRLDQSLEEYVKAAMLVRVLRASGLVEEGPGFAPVAWDASVGYDLAGIRSEAVGAFLRGMRDAAAVVEGQRRSLPPPWRDLDFPAVLASSVTLSTFHGCPPSEIEAIVLHLMQEHGLDCTVKLNPVLLGPAAVSELLHEVLGYHGLRVPESAFSAEAGFGQIVDIAGRLSERARELGLGFGLKLTNTLVVENHRAFFSGQPRMYLSGPPLHVLAVQLLRRLREALGPAIPISFSAGIDRHNFPDAVALGLCPVTVCTDLLKPGGYGRARAYHLELERRMTEAGCRTREQWILEAFGQAAAAAERLPPDQRAGCLEALEARDPRPSRVGAGAWTAWLRAAVSLNTERYAERVLAEPRYRAERNERPPRYVSSRLGLLDCLTCDKCIQVCPNDAVFAWDMPRGDTPVAKMRQLDGRWVPVEEGVLRVRRKHQIAVFFDSCNECGNCEVFCPEQGGPQSEKPLVFGHEEDWHRERGRDGFLLRRDRVLGRCAGAEFRLLPGSPLHRFEGEGFSVEIDPADPAGSIRGDSCREVDLGVYELLRALHAGIAGPGPLNPAAALLDPPPPGS